MAELSDIDVCSWEYNIQMDKKIRVWRRELDLFASGASAV
jgi:hypothetical protein